jgi:hypothetical protein
MATSPFSWIFYLIMFLVLIGGLIGLIVFVKLSFSLIDALKIYISRNK